MIDLGLIAVSTNKNLKEITEILEIFKDHGYRWSDIDPINPKYDSHEYFLEEMWIQTGGIGKNHIFLTDEPEDCEETYTTYEEFIKEFKEIDNNALKLWKWSKDNEELRKEFLGNLPRITNRITQLKIKGDIS